jgi:hypothetical protein
MPSLLFFNFPIIFFPVSVTDNHKNPLIFVHDQFRWADHNQPKAPGFSISAEAKPMAPEDNEKCRREGRLLVLVI